MKTILKSSLILLIAVSTNASAETDLWSIKVTPQYSYTDFKDSPTRNKMHNTGVFFDAEYLEQAGIAAGLSRTKLENQISTTDIEQDNFFVSLRTNITPDKLKGKVTLKADLHLADNNDITNETDDVIAWQPQISYLSFDKKYYFDLGYAYTRYGDSKINRGELNVQQLTPTIGLGLNQGYDWLQFRYYGIKVSNAQRTLSQDNTNALEAKWTHYFQGRGLIPKQVQVSGLLGERLYAVDSDTAALYNLSDMQKGSIALGAQWELNRNFSLLTNLGLEKYETLSANKTIDYDSRYVYLGLQSSF